MRWTSIWIHGPMQCKKFIILINLCVKFSYFILTQNNILIIPVKAVLTILYNINSILLTTSTICKNQLTACFKRLVATALQGCQCLWDSPLLYFKYIILYFACFVFVVCCICCCCSFTSLFSNTTNCKITALTTLQISSISSISEHLIQNIQKWTCTNNNFKI